MQKIVFHVMMAVVMAGTTKELQSAVQVESLLRGATRVNIESSTCLKWLYSSNKDFDKSLMAAMKRGAEKSVRIKLEYGYRVRTADKDIKTVFFLLAAKRGDIRLLESLLKAGVDVNVENLCDHHTALHYATQSGNKSMVEVLIKAGANVDIKSYNHYTAVHFAALGGFKAIMELLIKAGANVNAVNIFGETALHYAAQIGDTTIADLLIKAGIDINVAELFHRETALDYATKLRHTSMIALLLTKAFGQHNAQ